MHPLNAWIIPFPSGNLHVHPELLPILFHACIANVCGSPFETQSNRDVLLQDGVPIAKSRVNHARRQADGLTDPEG